MQNIKLSQLWQFSSYSKLLNLCGILDDKQNNLPPSYPKNWKWSLWSYETYSLNYNKNVKNLDTQHSGAQNIVDDANIYIWKIDILIK